MKYTFKGGIHVDEHKNAAGAKVKLFADPEKVVIPMSQHIGAPCISLVKKGDYVTAGQKIGEIPEGALGCPIHSSVSGTVESVERVTDLRGNSVECVTIVNDKQNTLCPDVSGFGGKLADATTDDIIKIIKEAGIVGMGGAGFPAHAKIASGLGKATTLILNCAECEPFLTANYRLMVERPKEIVGGAKILQKAMGISKVIIAVEDNKPKAIEILEEFAAKDSQIRVCTMKTKYPQGDERRLIYALTKKQLPVGKLPADVGCVIFNAETAAAVYTAFTRGLPSIYRIVTVDGDCIAEPSNVLAPIGTTLNELVEFCGGLVRPPVKVINGGPMMGASVWNPESSVTKTTSGILVFSKDLSEGADESACIRCGRCVKACPSGLMPCYLASYIKIGDYETAKEMGLMSCVECGSCAFGCPASVPLVSYFKIGKGELRKKKK